MNKFILASLKYAITADNVVAHGTDVLLYSYSAIPFNQLKKPGIAINLKNISQGNLVVGKKQVGYMGSFETEFFNSVSALRSLAGKVICIQATPRGTITATNPVRYIKNVQCVVEVADKSGLEEFGSMKLSGEQPVEAKTDFLQLWLGEAI